MTDINYADKIAKLLRKAESTSGPEGDALLAKAQELMITYSIDEEMIAKAQGQTVRDELTVKMIDLTGIYRKALVQIVHVVTYANTCRGFITERGNTVTYHVAGHTSDVDRVILLYTSVQLQATTGMRAHWRDASRPWMSAMEGYKTRREFYLGFARGLTDRLAVARQAAESAAASNHAEREHVAADDASTSVALVLRNRTDAVDDWFDETYGSKLHTVRRSYSSGGADARTAGVAAGRNADVGATRVGGSRQALA